MDPAPHQESDGSGELFSEYTYAHAHEMMQTISGAKVHQAHPQTSWSALFSTLLFSNANLALLIQHIHPSKVLDKSRVAIWVITSPPGDSVPC